MLQVARLSPKLLDDSAPLVAEFLHSQMNDDGGFRDRAGKSDLYYTAFGLQGLTALQQPLPTERIVPYLNSFGDTEGLDLVHLACLARCWASLPHEYLTEELVERLLSRLRAFQAADGGYSAQPGAERGSAYGCFLAFGAYEDLYRPLPNADAVLNCIQSFRSPEGGYANGLELPLGLTPPSAAAAMVQKQLGRQPDDQLKAWLLARWHVEGGFVVGEGVPMPDLLSTATALHALAGLQVDLEPFKEQCLDFVDTLWTARGGFYGNWEDDHLDCEYTYYGLLTLGHLSL